MPPHRGSPACLNWGAQVPLASWGETDGPGRLLAIIDEGRPSGAEDNGAVLSRLTANLSNLAPDQLEQFQKHFDEIQISVDAWERWRAAYMELYA
jgi:hypothetical protein